MKLLRSFLQTGLQGLLLISWSCSAQAEEPAYFRIRVVDEQTGRGVPLVELETVNVIRHYTDSAGWVAFYEPGLMDQDVFFQVKSHGYEFPKDGFGMQGRALKVKPGGETVLKIKRLNIAERLYRVTGGGIYRDSILLGLPTPVKQPLLSGLVLGQDSVFSFIYRDKIRWFYGDTAKPGYPLGNFQMSGAVSDLPGKGGLSPEVGVDLAYFADPRGFSREMAPVPGDGPTWADAFIVLPNEQGQESLWGAYGKIRPQNMEAHQRGFIRYNDAKEKFEPVSLIPLDAPLRPGGHAQKINVAGKEWVYFATPFPLTRVPATPGHYTNLSSYEAFTCLLSANVKEGKVDRGTDGAVRWSWRKDFPPLSMRDQETLVKAGILKPEETLIHLRDVETGKPIQAHAGSVYWNEYRKRWILIDCEIQGSSMLGETWYAEADDLVGPWVYARKIVTHDRYSFYNPKQHPFFDQEGGRIIYFEGTYTHTFSGNHERTPRYDYNQILYRLDLSDPRLALPVPVYEAEGATQEGKKWWTGKQNAGIGGVSFFALDRPRPGAKAVYERVAGGKARLTLEQPTEAARPLFYALAEPPNRESKGVVGLFPHAAGDQIQYSVADSLPGYERGAAPICWVWKNPMNDAVTRALRAEQ